MMKGNILLLIGTTVGAGIFSLPIVFRTTGVLPFFVLIAVLAFATWRLNIYFTDIVLHFKEKHQLPGYVKATLGPLWGRIAIALDLSSTYGALIAFAFIGGTFFSQLTGLSTQIGSTVFFIASTFLLFVSGKKLPLLDRFFAAAKGILFIIVVGLAVVFFPVQSYHLPAVIGTNPYLAYGLILFSFTGFSIIPELDKSKGMYRSLWISHVLIMGLYLIFTLVMSPFVQKEVFIFNNVLLTIIVNLTGFISVFTTYLLLSLISRDIFMRDLHMKEKAALCWTLFLPFLAIFFEIGSFVKILSLTGGLVLGGVGLLICVMSQVLFPQKNRVERLLIQLLLLGGMVLQVYILFI